ncbi:hypothetical protein QBC46DRAFT_351694 [Diplogelasinospora grovesii]|uniref:Uncharacterized protein n=1 Tax=Diplogelasinospora grovesii TaxID=303347 RepID=A0AAN6NDJ7_9PEZI|nr:hypothetical protein QBC46DRAFT_351694 [Diplogelasinospora grovesii]
MLGHRLNGKSRSESQHCKSLSSGHAVHLEHLDPTLARRDAQTAATQAYLRAQERNNDLMSTPRFPPESYITPPRRRRGESDHRNNIQDHPTQDHEPQTPGHRRRDAQDSRDQHQSMRFAAPTVRQAKPSYLPSTVHDDESYGDCSDTIAGHNSKQSVPNDFQAPRSRPPLFHLPRTAGMARDRLRAPATGDEHYTLGDGMPSAPSSYRHLPNAGPPFAFGGGGPTPSLGGSKSLLNMSALANTSRPSLEGSRPRANLEMPGRQPQPRLDSYQTLAQPRHLLTASRPRVEVSRPATKTKGTSQAGSSSQAERSWNWLDDFSHDVPSKPAPVVSPSKARNEEKRMRKSLRSSSPTEGTISTDQSDGDISRSTLAAKPEKKWKAKLKGFFRLGKTKEVQPFPAQHIEASRTHAFAMVGDRPRDDSYAATSRPLSEVPFRAASSVPDLSNYGPVKQVSSRVAQVQRIPSTIAHSVRGYVDDASEYERKVPDDKSLTSWANSAASTLNRPQAQDWTDWNQRRLSIINEDGAHAQGQSLRRPALGPQLFQIDEGGSGYPASPAPVNTELLISALKKRQEMNDNDASAQSMEQKRREDSEPVKPLRIMRPADSAITGGGPKTLGRVVPDRNCHSPSDEEYTPTRRSRFRSKPVNQDSLVSASVLSSNSQQFSGNSGNPAGSVADESKHVILDYHVSGHENDAAPETGQQGDSLMPAPLFPGKSRQLSGSSGATVPSGNQGAVVPTRRERPAHNTAVKAYSRYPQPCAGDGKGLSPPTKLVPRGLVRQAEDPASLSIQDPRPQGSPDSHLFRTSSEYRYTLRETMDLEGFCLPQSIDHPLTAENLAELDSMGKQDGSRNSQGPEVDGPSNSQGAEVDGSSNIQGPEVGGPNIRESIAYSESVYSQDGSDISREFRLAYRREKLRERLRDPDEVADERGLPRRRFTTYDDCVVTWLPHVSGDMTGMYDPDVVHEEFSSPREGGRDVGPSDPHQSLDEEAVPSPPGRTTPAHHRKVSSVSSVGWKERLASEIARIKLLYGPPQPGPPQSGPPQPGSPQPGPPQPLEIGNALPTMPQAYLAGHRRESAQTNDTSGEWCDDDVFSETIPLDSPTKSPTIPPNTLTTMQQNVVKQQPRLPTKWTAPPSSTGRAFLENEAPSSVPPRDPFDDYWGISPPAQPRGAASNRWRPSLTVSAVIDAYSNNDRASVSPSLYSHGLTGEFEKQFGPGSTEHGSSSGHRGHTSPRKDDKSPFCTSHLGGSDAFL